MAHPPDSQSDSAPVLERAALLNWLVEDARLGRVSIAEIAVIAAKSSDPNLRAIAERLCALEYRRALTLLMLASGKLPHEIVEEALTDSVAGIDPRILLLENAIAKVTRNPHMNRWQRVRRWLWATWKIWFSER